MDIRQYVTTRLPLHPKLPPGDTWIITAKYLVKGAWRYDVENVTNTKSRLKTMKRLFERDLQATPFQPNLF